MEELAPIILFVYARPDHTKKMIESLKDNKLADKSEVWIFSDNAKRDNAIERVEKVREYIHKIEKSNYFKKVHIVEAKENKGLAKSVIEGVSEIIKKAKKAIVVEDDLILSNNFIEYMNDALNFYENDNRIWSISGYNVPINIPKTYKEDVYLGYRGCSWGWATWENRWKMVDWNVSDYDIFKRSFKRRRLLNRGGDDMAQMLDMQMNGKIDSWAIRWCYEQSKRNMYTIYPVKSLVYNEGLDGTGTHSGITSDFSVIISNEKRNMKKDIEVNKEISRNFKSKYKIGIKGKIKEMLIIMGLEGVVNFARKNRNKI